MYKVINKAVSKELAEFCYNYLRTKRKVVKFFREQNYIPRSIIRDSNGDTVEFDIGWGCWWDHQVPNTYNAYGDIVMETLLTKLQPLIEIETKTKLIPTYSYTRLYKKDDILQRHRDRDSCKISITLNLGGDPWPIFLDPSKKEEQKGISVLLEPGDMLIYDGSVLEHWREAFKGENCGQVFLHYNEVSKNNEYKYDKRPFLGLPQNFRGFKLNDDYCRS